MKKRFALGLVAALLLAGCTSESASESTPQDGGSNVALDVGAETVVDELDVTVGPATLKVQVLPLVRTTEALVLTLDVTAQDPDNSLTLGPVRAVSAPWSSRNSVLLPEWIGLRLLDLRGDRVVPPALDAAEDVVAALPARERGVTKQRMQVAYGDPGVDELALFLPQGGVVPRIPVIDADAPAVNGGDPLDLTQIASAPVYPMVDYSLDIASTTRTRAEPKKVTIALGADVLFATDDDDLNPAASKVIADAAAAVKERSPGPVRVIGHTDSEGTDAYNQRLSQRRAAAVASSLGKLIDTKSYPMQVSGRGESEPVASNTTVDGRAQNRRVELIIETEQSGEGTERGTAELLPIDGPTATGAEGLTLNVGRDWHVSAPRAYVVEGHLMVEIKTKAVDDDVKSVIGPALYEGSFTRPDGLQTLRSMGGLAVMNGSVGTIPALHQASEDRSDVLLPVTDLATFSRLDGGDTRTSVVVYPRGIEVGSTVTIDLLGVYNAGWRLTDIPVEQLG